MARISGGCSSQRHGSYVRKFRRKYPRYGGGYGYLYYGNLYYPYGNPHYHNFMTKYGSCVQHGNTGDILVDNCNYMNGMIAKPIIGGGCTCVNINNIDYGFGNRRGATSYNF